MKDRLSKLSILVVNFKYDLRDDNDLVVLQATGKLLKYSGMFPVWA